MRFSLRTLIEFVFVLCVALWVWRVYYRPVGVIKPGDVLTIQGAGTMTGASINGPYRVDPSGDVHLAPEYGTVHLESLSLAKARTTIEQHLSKILRDPQVSVEFAGEEELLRLQREVRRLEIENRELRQGFGLPAGSAAGETKN